MNGTVFQQLTVRISLVGSVLVKQILHKFPHLFHDKLAGHVFSSMYSRKDQNLVRGIFIPHSHMVQLSAVQRIACCLNFHNSFENFGKYVQIILHFSVSIA